jgi:hypothetical protein
MMPDGIAFVLTSSNERGGVPSAKKRVPVPGGSYDDAACAKRTPPGTPPSVALMGGRPQLAHYSRRFQLAGLNTAIAMTPDGTKPTAKPGM